MARTVIAAGIAGLFCLGMAASAAFAQEGVGQDSLAVFVGKATDTNFTESMFMPWTNVMKDIGVAGVAYSHRFGSVEDLWGNGIPMAEHLYVEGETGLSMRFGDESMGEGWAGLYLRYDGFPWNDRIYTTLAVNTGISYLTDESDFERGRDENNKNNQLLHYMGPEITFSDPGNKNLELLVRFHHRSGVFGLFDGVISGSTFISSGVRWRF